MSSFPIQLLSTDFDGTLFSEFENPPIPRRLQAMIGDWQAQGAKWVINTGRDLSSLMEALGRARLTVKPDFLVLVEREIYQREDSKYVGLTEWNHGCHLAHAELFQRVQPQVPYLNDWISKRFSATTYEDSYSPFCLIAESNADADVIHEFLNEFCQRIPGLTVVRNDVYARFSHVDYNKGMALQEISKRLGILRDQVLAAGDHLNDLPMLSNQYARWLVAPANAIPEVKAKVRAQHGYVSELSHGHGIADGMAFHLQSHAEAGQKAMSQAGNLASVSDAKTT